MFETPPNEELTVSHRVSMMAIARTMKYIDKLIPKENRSAYIDKYRKLKLGFPFKE